MMWTIPGSSLMSPVTSGVSGIDASSSSLFRVDSSTDADSVERCNDYHRVVEIVQYTYHQERSS